MKPAYKILANGADITALIADRLLELSIVDEAGVKSDRLTLLLDDRDQKLAIPKKGASLNVSIGYEKTGLVFMGIYVVDEVEVTGGPYEMTIRASATDFNSKICAQRERSWHDTTLGAIARKIAGEHGLEPVISPKAGAIKIKHSDQNESDIAYLTRLAAHYQCVVKTPEDKLVLAERGRSKAISGQPLRTITVEPTLGASWSMTTTGRGSFTKVKAYWQDKSAGKRKAEIASGPSPTGVEDRTMTLPHTYSTEKEAKAAAQSKLDAIQKAESTFNIKDMVGKPDIFAEQKIVAKGFRAGVDGEWVVTKVEHKISGNGGGFTTNVDAELPV